MCTRVSAHENVYNFMQAPLSPYTLRSPTPAICVCVYMLMWILDICVVCCRLLNGNVTETPSTPNARLITWRVPSFYLISQISSISGFNGFQDSATRPYAEQHTLTNWLSSSGRARSRSYVWPFTGRQLARYTFVVNCTEQKSVCCLACITGVWVISFRAFRFLAIRIVAHTQQPTKITCARKSHRIPKQFCLFCRFVEFSCFIIECWLQPTFRLKTSIQRYFRFDPSYRRSK